MVAVDTNALVRLLTRDDARQLKRAESHVANGAWVSLVVLVETMWVLRASYRLAPDDIAAALDMLLAHQQVTIESPETVAGALQTLRDHPALGFSDCLVLELARRAGHLPLGTFDRALSRVDGAKKL